MMAGGQVPREHAVPDGLLNVRARDRTARAGGPRKLFWGNSGGSTPKCVRLDSPAASRFGKAFQCDRFCDHP